MQWEVVIGIETHAQLATRSKIFSGASTAFGAAPNTQACAVDLALPGTLPVLNRGAVECAIKFGLAVDAHIASESIFARKNYFYPDLPKGYQISQYEIPIVQGGHLSFLVEDKNASQIKSVRLTRAHLEEDAGKSLHEDFAGMTGIDLNRAGTPLLEIVSEPDMRSSKEAVAYAKALHSLVVWLGICDGNMQEGSFRCDANVSVRQAGTEKLGTRREIKNLNSFRFLQQAIDYEMQWQIETLEDGNTIEQATVLFDPETGRTHMMRSKEDAHDYRYFPDPDLLPLAISSSWIEEIKTQLPELPAVMCKRFVQSYSLSEYDAQILTSNKALASYYEVIAEHVTDKKIAANWVIGELAAALNESGLTIEQAPISAIQLAGLIQRLLDGTINNKTGKEIFNALWKQEAENADTLIERHGLKQISDSSALEKIIDEILAANAPMVAEYKAGKEKAFNALVGQCMKASKGKANPAQVNAILKTKLG